jgi:hypothetical protein
MSPFAVGQNPQSSVLQRFPVTSAANREAPPLLGPQAMDPVLEESGKMLIYFSKPCTPDLCS